jgi:glutathione synthase
VRLCFVVNSPRTQRATYTTLHLAHEALGRGHEVCFLAADGFSLEAGDDGGRVLGQVVRAKRGRYRTARRFAAALRADEIVRETIDLGELDVLLLRNNPNVGAGADDAVDRINPALDFARRLRRQGVLVVNDPDGLMRASSKMYLAGFPEEIRPRTLISRNLDTLKEFIRTLDGPAIIKPLAGFGGQNVFYVQRGEVANLHQMIGVVRKQGHVIAQEYLPAVAQGDKRVLLLGGAPIRVSGPGGERVAAYTRMRPKDDIRNNMHVGGSRQACDFTDAEQRICDLLRPRLQADGLLLVGVDLVGDKVLEINVFAPGGIHNINELYGVNVAAAIVDDLERRVVH